MNQEKGEASSSGQAMEVDDENKKALSEPVVTVDATKVAEEKEEEAAVEGEETMGAKRSRRGEGKTRERCHCGQMLEGRRRCELC